MRECTFLPNRVFRVTTYIINIVILMSFFSLLIFPKDTCAAKRKRRASKTTQGIWNPELTYKSWSTVSKEKRDTLTDRTDDLRQQLQSNPDSAKLHFELGKTLYELCLLDDAQQMLEKARSLDANNAKTHYLLGCVYFFTRQHDKSIVSIRQAKRKGFRIDRTTESFFRKRTPEDIKQLRRRIHAKRRKPYQKTGANADTIDAVLALPDDQIDIATGALLIARHAAEHLYGQSVDINAYQTKIDAMADELTTRIDTETDPLIIIEIINTYIYKDLKFVSIDKSQNYFIDPKNPDASQKILQQRKYSLLNFTLDEKKGTAFSLTMLYLSLAQRLELPFYAMLAPFHIFVHYDDSQVNYNLEVAHQGKDISNIDISRNNPGIDITDTWYMRPLSNKETVFAYITGISELYIIKQQFDTVIPLLNDVLDAEPVYLKPYVTLGNIYYGLKRYDDAITEYEKALSIYPAHIPILLNLAVSYMELGNYPSMLDALKKAEQQDNNSAQLLYLMGLYYIRVQNFEQAKTYLIKSDKLDPHSLPTHQLLVKAYYGLGKPAKAYKHAKIIVDSGQPLTPDQSALIEEIMALHDTTEQDNDNPIEVDKKIPPQNTQDNES